LELEQRRAVSTYLETFLLVAVAAGGSAAVFSAMAGYVGTSRGAEFAVTGAEMRQGTYAALERISIANTGTASLGSFTLTSTIPPSAQYCANLVYEPGGGTVGFAPPPPACGQGAAADPASITIVPSEAVASGETVVLSVVIYSSSEFQAGTEYSMVVSASGAAEQVTVVAVPG